jgi:hypothetical protein
MYACKGTISYVINNYNDIIYESIELQSDVVVNDGGMIIEKNELIVGAGYRYYLLFILIFIFVYKYIYIYLLYKEYFKYYFSIISDWKELCIFSY